MRPIIKKIFRAIILQIIFSLGSCQNKIDTLPYYNSPMFEPIWHHNKDSRLHTIPSFAFVNQDSQIITDKNLDNNITLVNFIFTTCGGICPDMTKNLRTVQDTFANDTKIHFLSFSVKPWEDSVPRLKEFAGVYGIHKKQWSLLTGDKAQIYSLARRGFFAEEDAGYNKDSTQFLHTENVLLIDGNKHIRGIYKGTLPLDMQHIIADIRILKKEQGE